MLNPLTQDRNYIIIYFSVWLSIAIIQGFALFFYIGVSITSSLFDASIFNGVYALIGISFWYMTRFISLEYYTASRLFTNHIAAAFVTSGIWIGISYFMLTNLIVNEDYLAFLKASLIWRFFIGILFYFVIAAFNYVMIYYSNFKEKVLRETELNALVKEAELTSLKYQINPHFIFNSLNSISSLTVSDPKKAQEMTIKLSEFMRKTFSKNDHQTIKLKDEINSVNIYLDIEKVRFEDKFEFVNELPEDCLELEVPNMILQPLFENAIKHGVYESIKKVYIHLTCEESEEYIKLIVSNDFDPESMPRKGEGIGLKNIKNRLKLIYKQENLITSEKVDEKFIVKLFIPKEK